MKAIQVRFIPETGRRIIGDGISAKDLKLNGTRSHPTWQNIDAGVEIHLIVKGDPNRFDGMEGVTVFDGEEAIDAAVARLHGTRKPMLRVFNEALMIETAKELEVLRELGGKSEAEQLQILFDAGCAGVCVDELPPPITCADMCAGYAIEA